MGDPRRRSRLHQVSQPAGADTDLLPENKEFQHPEALELPKPSPSLDHFPDLEILDPPQFYPRFSKPTRISGSSSDQSAAPSWRNRLHLSPATGRTPKGEKEVVAELLLILVDCMEELNTRNRESLLRKFFAEIERDERLERFIVGRLRQSRVTAISELCEKLPARVRGQMSSGGGNSGSVIIDEKGGEEDSTSNYGNFSDLGRHPQFCGDAEFLEAMESEGTTSDRGIVGTVEELSEKLERFKIKTLDVRVAVNEEDNK